jgi:hypothetical protein
MERREKVYSHTPYEHCDIDLWYSLCERVNSGRVDGLKTAFEEFIRSVEVSNHLSLTPMRYSYSILYNFRVGVTIKPIWT